MPKDATIHFVSVIGSRAKGLSGSQSDYDIRAIMSFPKNTYLLQTQPDQRKIDTKIDDIEVEGTVIDLHTALKYAIDTNPFIYDTLYGLVIFEDKVSDGVKDIFLKSFEQDKIRKAAAGHVVSCLPKKQGGKVNDRMIIEGKTTVLKIACEAAYLATRVKFINTNVNEVPPFNVFKLIERSFSPEEEQTKNMVTKIVEDRIANKNGEYVVPSEFTTFLSQSLDKELIQQSHKKSKEELEEVIQRKNEFFLGLFGEKL